MGQLLFKQRIFSVVAGVLFTSECNAEQIAVDGESRNVWISVRLTYSTASVGDREFHKLAMSTLGYPFSYTALLFRFKQRIL